MLAGYSIILLGHKAGPRRALIDCAESTTVLTVHYTSTPLGRLAFVAELGLEEISQACPSPCTITALERCSASSTLVARSIVPIY